MYPNNTLQLTSRRATPAASSIRAPGRLAAELGRLRSMRQVSRRNFVLGAGAVAIAIACPPTLALHNGAESMYGLIGRINAAPGKRDELIATLLGGVAGMPGCLSYIAAKDSTDENAIWVTEVWDSRASHEASLSLPSVQEAIAKGQPLIAGFGERFETLPIGIRNGSADE
jgi:quinol monooxygenase YgiN